MKTVIPDRLREILLALRNVKGGEERCMQRHKLWDPPPVIAALERLGFIDRDFMYDVPRKCEFDSGDFKLTAKGEHVLEVLARLYYPVLLVEEVDAVVAEVEAERTASDGVGH